MAKAYWIAFYRSIENFDALFAYAELAVPALALAGGRELVRSVAEKVYEAGLERRVAVLEFDSVQQAIAAHDSSRYQAALRALGTGAAERDIRIVEATPEELLAPLHAARNDARARAYWIAFYRSISNPDALAAYASLAVPAIRSAGGRYLASGLPVKVYEAGLNERVAMIELDSVQHAIAAHNSPGYQAALKVLGSGSAERDMRIVEQLPEWK